MLKPVVAIVGRPNVGKSTLFNRIIRKRKAIVGNLPGITRDRNYATAEYDGRPFLLIDTGGFDPYSPDLMLQQMKAQAQLAIDEADHILFVLDGREGLTPLDREVHAFLRSKGKQVYAVVNKIDSANQEQGVLEFYELGVERLFTIAAEHAMGISELMEEVVRSFPQSEPSVDQSRTPISVIGRPNVGKSTLINALLGQERLITSEIPGTTRDTIDTLFEYDNEPYLLIDTAGIRKKSKVTHRVEKYSIIMVLKSIERSDVCLIVIDGTEGVTGQDIKIAGLAHEAGAASILLVNKWDLVRDRKQQKKLAEEIRIQLKFMDYCPVLFVSALTGQSLHKIFPMVRKLKQAFFRSVSTSDVNSVLQEAVRSHEPPFFKRHKVKFFYGTQTGVAPPAFVLFVNAPAGVHFSYLRYLTNTFRGRLGFQLVPLWIFLRKRK